MKNPYIDDPNPDRTLLSISRPCANCGCPTGWTTAGKSLCPDCNCTLDIAAATLQAAKKPINGEPHPHTFNRAALTTIGRATAICNQRADEYKDSWDLANLRMVFLDAILDRFGVKLTPEQKRLVIMSSLCDVKLSRVAGPFKTDTYDDNINYTGALCELRREWEEQQTQGTK